MHHLNNGLPLLIALIRCALKTQHKEEVLIYIYKTTIKGIDGKLVKCGALFDDNGLIESATKYFSYLALISDLANGTKNRYAEGILSFVRYLNESRDIGAQGNLSTLLLHTNRMVIDQWLKYEWHINKVGRSARRVRESGVKLFFTFLSSEAGGYVFTEDNQPYGRQPKLTTKSPMRKRTIPLTEHFIREILLSFHNECERVMWHFAYDAAPRISEICLMRKKHIDTVSEFYRFNQNHKYFLIEIPTLKKGSSEPIDLPALISLPCLQRIIRYHSSNEYMFSPNWDMNDPEKPAFLTATGKPWKPGNAAKQLKSATFRSDIKLRIYPHIFRHSSALSILTSNDHGDNHVDRLLQVWLNLRHAGISSTEVYARLPSHNLISIDENTSVFDRSKRLFEDTFLSPRCHTEQRGHRI